MGITHRGYGTFYSILSAQSLEKYSSTTRGSQAGRVSIYHFSVSVKRPAVRTIDLSLLSAK